MVFNHNYRRNDMEQQQNSKNQTGQQSKMPPAGNPAVGATQGMPKASQNEKPTQASSAGQSNVGQANQEGEQTDKNNRDFPPDLQMDQQMDQKMNKHDKSTEVSESRKNPNDQGSSNKGSVNMDQQRTGVQIQHNSNQNK